MVTFLKAQAAAVTGSAIDFLVFTILIQAIGSNPDKSSIAIITAIGAFCGGLLNFVIVRKWVFNEGQKGAHVQAGRYILVWAGSILLNTSGMSLVTYFIDVYHRTPRVMLSIRVLVSIAVGVTYNYFLQKRFVFK